MAKTKKKDRKASVDLDFDFDLINGLNKPVVTESTKKQSSGAAKSKKAKIKDEEKQKQEQAELQRLAQKFPVALADSQLPVGVPKQVETSNLPSIIGRDQGDIHDLIEQGRWDEVQSVMYKRMAQSVSSLLPYLENEIRNTQGKRGAFNFNAMITTVRDLLGDIQQAQDRGRLGELLVDKLLRPSFMDVGMVFIKEHDLLQSRLRQTLDPEAMRQMQLWLDAAQVRFVDQIQEEFRKLHEKVKEFLER